MHPSVCRFTSEVFYERRLRPRPDLSLQSIGGDTKFAGAGLFFARVEHDGNQTAYEERRAEHGCDRDYRMVSGTFSIRSLYASAVATSRRIEDHARSSPFAILNTGRFPWFAQRGAWGATHRGARTSARRG